MAGLTDGEVFNNAVLAFTPNGGAEVDLSLYIQEVRFKESRRELDNTRMGHTSMSRKKGLGEWEFSTVLINQFGDTQGGVNINKVIHTELTADTVGTIRFRAFNAPISVQNPEWTGPATVFDHGFGGKVGDLLTTGPTFKSAGNLTFDEVP